MKYYLLLITLLVINTSVLAEDQTLGPDVRILQNKHSTIEEFRSHGRVYMIRINPSKGRPYYLIDADGDGELETRKNELSPNLLIPSWVIFSW